MYVYGPHLLIKNGEKLWDVHVVMKVDTLFTFPPANLATLFSPPMQWSGAIFVKC